MTKKTTMAPEACACECDALAASLAPHGATATTKGVVGAGDLGLIMADLKDAAASYRSGDLFGAAKFVKAAFDEAWKAFTSTPETFAATGPAPVGKIDWASLLQKLLPLLLSLLGA